MALFAKRSVRPEATVAEDDLPRLELSGPVLSEAFQGAIKGSEAHGGIEAYVNALQLKAQMFKEALFKNRDVLVDAEKLASLCTFMPTVRRRIGAYLDGDGATDNLIQAVRVLLDGIENTRTVDARMHAFCSHFPGDKKHRWVKDLGADILHNVDPERYPLMSRWIWDAHANTGVLREIWYGDDVDYKVLDVPEHFGTYVTLRSELGQFLNANGVFRDMLQYVDLLCAQVYAEYICSQGGTYLRADFSTPEDPMQHARRMLGLDGVTPSGRTRLKSASGEAFMLGEAPALEFKDADHANS